MICDDKIICKHKPKRRDLEKWCYEEGKVLGLVESKCCGQIFHYPVRVAGERDDLPLPSWVRCRHYHN